MGRHILYLGGVAHKEMKMQRFFYLKEIRQPTDVIEHLAKGKRDWRKGYSAYELAHSWVNADGIPRSVRTVLDTAPRFANAELIEGFFEREIDLRTAGHPSQTDLMALIKSPGGYRRGGELLQPSRYTTEARACLVWMRFATFLPICASSGVTCWI